MQIKKINKAEIYEFIRKIKKTADERYKNKDELNAIEIKNLVIDYGETVAVDNANIQIKKGELVTLLGPSGCGKTTTLNAIAGLLTPTSGQILFEGVDITKTTPQDRKIGLVFQNYALYPHLNVYDNISFPLTNDKTWKVRMIEKSTKAQHEANLIILEKNGATKQEIDNFNKLLFNFFDVYKELNLEINNLNSSVYKKLNELNSNYELALIKKQNEQKKANLDTIEKLKDKSLDAKLTRYEHSLKIKEIKTKYSDLRKSLKNEIEKEKQLLKQNSEYLELKQLKSIYKSVVQITKNDYYSYQKELIKKYTLDISKLNVDETNRFKELQTKNISIKKAIENAVLNVAEKVEITKNLHKKPTKLSGGQQQRVAIARGIVREPKIILMDEPLSNLDAKLRVQTRQWIRKIQSELGLTTVFVTHDQEEAMSISDKIVCMSFGKIQQIGTPMELYNKPKNEFVAKFLGIPEMTIFDANIKENHVFLNDVVLKHFETNLENVRVGIRAEDIQESLNGKLTGKIVSIEYLGKEIFAKIEVDNVATFNIFLKLKKMYEINEEVKFNIPANKIHLFDSITKERIDI
ncbi:ATP-binding cassette domain-containing protein [Mycoplasma sp. Z386]